MGESSYCYKYPRPAVTTDCVLFGLEEGELSVLLIQRGREPYKGCWAFPGGFMEMDEDAEHGALRELREETGLEPMEIRQLGAYTGVDRDPRGRVITIAYYALVGKGEVRAADDAAAARWFPIGEIPPLAFDHDQILRDALQALRRDEPHLFNSLR